MKNPEAQLGMDRAGFKPDTLVPAHLPSGAPHGDD